MNIRTYGVIIKFGYLIQNTREIRSKKGRNIKNCPVINISGLRNSSHYNWDKGKKINKGYFPTY